MRLLFILLLSVSSLAQTGSELSLTGVGRGTASAGGTPTFLRGNSASGSCNPNCTLTIASVDSGSLVVVAVEAFSSTVTGVSGSVQGALTQAITANDTNQTYRLYIFYKANATASASTETFTISATSTFVRRGAADYSNVLTSSPLDGAGACTVNGNSGSLASGTFTVVTGDLIVGWGFANAGSAAQGSGFTKRTTATVDGNVIFEDQVISGTTANTTATASSGDWSMCGVGFKHN